MFSYNGVLVFVTVYTLYVMSTGTALQIELDPVTYTEETPGTANISCLMDAKDADVKDIFVIEIVKDGGLPFVFLKTSGISFSADIPDLSKILAVGHIDKDVSKSYLTLSLLEPNESDEGLYTCKLFYIDEAGLIKEHRASSNFTVDSITLRQLLGRLMSLERMLKVQTIKGSELQDTVRRLEVENGNQSAQVTQLTAKGSELKDTVRRLEAENGDQSAQVTQLASKVSELTEKNWKLSQTVSRLTDQATYVSAFSAGLKANVDVPAWQVVVFNSVFMKEGQGYDDKTGIFTAPVKGLYAIHLALNTRCNGCVANCDIKVNDVTKAGVYGWNPSIPDQSSASFVRVLQAGDQVKTVTSGEKSHLSGGSRSLFSGYLIKVM